MLHSTSRHFDAWRWSKKVCIMFFHVLCSTPDQLKEKFQGQTLFSFSNMFYSFTNGFFRLRMYCSILTYQDTNSVICNVSSPPIWYCADLMFSRRAKNLLTFPFDSWYITFIHVKNVGSRWAAHTHTNFFINAIESQCHWQFDVCPTRSIHIVQ